MKKFNKTISIEVEVDTIAQKLFNSFDKEFKHTTIVTEAIIGNLLNSKGPGISQLYNSLNGHNNDIDFQIGDEVVVRELSAYVWNPKKQDTQYVSMNGVLAEVVDIDLYSDKKVRVKYNVQKSEDSFKDEEVWTLHTKCNKVPPAEPTVLTES